ncbi:TPA: conjugative transfer relaxase/helicase TraI [Photobacterium damselae]
MLSLSPLRASASGAADYYLKEEQQLNNQPEFTFSDQATIPEPSTAPELNPTDTPTVNYYLAEKSDQKNTEWFGNIAKKEGILGQEIHQDKLESVLNGQLDNTQTPRANTENRRTGYDLVFSAPKGASIMALVYGDTRIIEAHDQAVKHALSQLETDTAQAKVVQNKERHFENTHNMLFGLVQHRTSRKDEPQLHTHALAANMTYDSQGGLKNLASSTVQNGIETQGTYERILENQKYYGMLYHSEMGRALEDMGYAIKSLGKGQIDIEHIPEDVIEANSSRRQEILASAKEKGWDSPKSRDHIAHQTRTAKTYTPEHSLQKEWQENIEKLDFDGLQFVADSYTHSHVKSTPALAHSVDYEQAIENSITHLSDRQTAFSYEKILTIAVAHYSPKGAMSWPSLKQSLDNKIENNSLIALDDKQTSFTTQALLDSEQKLIDTTQKRGHKLSVHASPSALNELNVKVDTKKTLADVLASKKTVNVVNVSGSSQSISEALLHTTENSGKAIHFITPNKLAQRQTENQVKRQAFSVTQWVKNAFRPDVVHTAYQYLNQPKLANETKNSVLVIEHANRLGIKETQQLIERAQEQGNKLIFLNHTKRSQGLRASNAMEILQKGNSQTFQWQGAQHNRTQVKTQEVDKSQRHQEVAKTYLQRSQQERSHTQVLATNTRDAKQLNDEIRYQLDKTGQLSENRVELNVLNPVFLSDQQKTMIKHYQKGMVLTELHSEGATRYTIEKVNMKSNTLQLLDGDKKRTYLDVATMNDKPRFFHQPEQLEVAAGDRLRVNGDIFQTDLKHHDTFTVEKIGWLGMSLKDDNGKGHLVPLSALEHSPLSYGYATTFNNAQPDKEITLVDMQSYTASKETLYDLMQLNSHTMQIFTNDQEKLHAHLEKSQIQPTAMSRVMASTDTLDKYINAQTHQALQQDVNAAVSALLEQQAPKPLIDQAVQFALNHVSEQQAGFKHTALVVEAIRFAMDEKGTTVLEDEINSKLDTLSQQGRVLSAQYSDGTRWVTKEAIETEQRILGRLEAGKGQVQAYSQPSHAQRYLAQQDWLTDGQKAGIQLIATTKDRYTIIQGFAGVGKSTMLEQGTLLIEQAQALRGNDKIDVIGLAPTHAAVNELKEKGIPAQTTQSLLKDLLTGDTTPDKYKNTLFLLDESSMASNAQFDAFTALVNHSGARATFLGDMHQLQSKEAGKPFELAYYGNIVETVVMKDIKRQQTPELLNAVQAVIDKQPASSLASLQTQEPLTAKHYNKQSEHKETVISTYQDTGKPIEDKKAAKEALYSMAAAEYLSRTPEARENTLLIAYSNRERDHLAELIRPELKKLGELDKQDYSTERLRGIGVTKEELKTMMPYKKGLIINTGRDNYYLINNVDKKNELLEITNLKTDETTTLIPKRHDHTLTTLWSSSHQPLSQGDKITWRKTDKELGLKGNTELTVSHIDKEKMTLEQMNGGSITLTLGDMKSTHWDYRYTKTADMAQGSTYKYVITAIDSWAKLTNLRRMYIDESRASQHVMLFTDNKDTLIRSWLNHFDDKSSAIETLNKVTHPDERHFNTATIPQENPKYQQNGEFILSLYAKDLSKQLTPYIESLAIELLGQPNNSKSDKDYLAFGQDNSHLKVSLTGEYRGYFRNWTTGDKGNAINLMMASKSLSFKEAVALAENMVKDPESYHLVENEQHDKLMQTLPKQVSELKARAISYFEQGQPLTDTPANRYINEQTYHDFESHPNLRFHPDVYSSETQSTHPALLAALTNNKGEIEAIEITYLNQDGDLADLTISKRLMGNKSGYGVPLNEGTLPNISVIAIGIENGIALLGANSHDVDITAVNNTHDLRTLKTEHLREHIIIMASDQQLSNDNLVNDITNKLNEKGHQVSIVKEDVADLSPQDISIYISDKVNDELAQLKGGLEKEVQLITDLVDEIQKGEEVSDKEMETLVDIIEQQDLHRANELEDEHIEHHLSEYEDSQKETILDKDLELDFPSL